MILDLTRSSSLSRRLTGCSQAMLRSIEHHVGSVVSIGSRSSVQVLINFILGEHDNDFLSP